MFKESVSDLLQAPLSPALRTQNPWPLVWALVLPVVFLVVNMQIMNDWRVYSFDDGTYSHAYLMPFMSAYLLYTAWRGGELQLRWSWVFTGLFVVSLLLYQWVDIAHQRFVARALVPLCLLLMLLSVYQISRYLVAAAALFCFVAPIWGPVNELLQWSSVHAVATIMGYTGIPTFVYAEYVQIPAGTFEIADGCSGLRYVIATLALVCFYCALYMRSYAAIAVFGLAALFGAMLTNWLRIVALILIGHFTEMQSPLIADHNMFGWFLFFPLMFFIFRFADRLEPRVESECEPSAEAVSTERDSGLRGLNERSYKYLISIIFIAFLFSGSSVRWLMGERIFSAPHELNVTTALPVTLSPKGDPAPTLFAVGDLAQDSLMGSSGVVYRIDFDGSTDAARVEFYLNEMTPEGWRLISSVPSDDAQELIIEKNGQQAMVHYAYAVDGTWTNRKRDLRALRLSAALRLDRRSELAWGLTYCAQECGVRERSSLARQIPPPR